MHAICPAARALRVAALVVGLAVAAAASAVTVVVPGTSNPWLAGMPDGTNAISNDSAPAHSPVAVAIGLAPGALTFTNASGGVSHTGSCPGACHPIDGATMFDHSGGDEHGIAALRAPIDALVGVFLGAGQPDLEAAPPGLDFSPAGLGIDFANLAPQLRQVFFIGDGMTSGSLVQQFVIPTGATRLFLGTHDGFGWFNNNGAITVDVQRVGVSAIPEPQTTALMLAGLAALVAIARRRR